eukprot:6214258-Pleurochrysis_carterae.AAC.2
MLRGELAYAALQLAPRNLDDIPPIADTYTGPGATRAALRAQVEHENKLKQESKEELVRDNSNRIASFLATSVRPRAGLKLRKLQDTHAKPLYPSMYDGMQMYKELKDELSSLHDAHDADEHERAQGQRPHQGPQPVHVGPLCGQKTRTTYHQVPASGASRRRTHSTARSVRQERARQGKLRNRLDDATGQDGSRRGTGLGSLQRTVEEGEEGNRRHGIQPQGRQLTGKSTARRSAVYELPNGQWCSKGYCHFKHDKVNPGGPCYGDPRWPGPLPDKVLKN